MEIELATMAAHKRIALVAHDNKKRDLVEWARYNRDVLVEHELLATGTTGQIIEQELGVPVQRLQSGPLGGDLQIGALVTTGDIDFLVFFWDPLEPHPHDPDVKALLRIAVVWNIPIACNRATADFVVSSALMHARYDRRIPDYGGYMNRLALVDEPGLGVRAGTPLSARTACFRAGKDVHQWPDLKIDAGGEPAQRDREGNH